MHFQVLALSFLLGLSATVRTVTAQNPTATQIELLSKTYPAGALYTSTFKGSGPPDLEFSGRTYYYNFDILASPNGVVGIIVVNHDHIGSASSILLAYHFPRSLPPGPYQFRLSFANTSISTLSDIFTIVAPSENCFPPPPWKPVASTSDPNYNLLRIVSPAAGSAQWQLSLGKPNDLFVSWDFRDLQDIVTIPQHGSIPTFEYVSPSGSSINVMHPNWIEPLGASLPMNDTGVSVGEWRIRMNYTIFGQGSRQSALSETFHIVEECFRCAPNGTASCKGNESGGGGGSNGTGSGNGSRSPNGMVTIGNWRPPESFGLVYCQAMVFILMAFNL